MKNRKHQDEMLTLQEYKGSKDEEVNLLFTFYLAFPLGVSYCARCKQYIVFYIWEKY
jgi:hypothetical protein